MVGVPTDCLLATSILYECYCVRLGYRYISDRLSQRKQPFQSFTVTDFIPITNPVWLSRVGVAFEHVSELT